MTTRKSILLLLLLSLTSLIFLISVQLGQCRVYLKDKEGAYVSERLNGIRKKVSYFNLFQYPQLMYDENYMMWAEYISRACARPLDPRLHPAFRFMAGKFAMKQTLDYMLSYLIERYDLMFQIPNVRKVGCASEICWNDRRSQEQYFVCVFNNPTYTEGSGYKNILNCNNNYNNNNNESHRPNHSLQNDQLKYNPKDQLKYNPKDLLKYYPKVSIHPFTVTGIGINRTMRDKFKTNPPAPVVPFNGCFKWNGKNLEDKGPNYYDFVNEIMTVQLCYDFCSEKKYRLAALTFGNTCKCFKTRVFFATYYDKIGKTFCNKPCYGNASEICGGDDWISSVYII